jgi:hypothetical protein
MKRETFSELAAKKTSQDIADVLHVNRETVRRWTRADATVPEWAVDALRRGGPPPFLQHRRDGAPMLTAESANTDIGRKLLELSMMDARHLDFVRTVLAPIGALEKPE